MLQYDLNAQVRSDFGKGASRSLRRGGDTPAVLYGSKSESISLKFDTAFLTQTLFAMQRRNAVFNLSIDGGTRHALLKEIQTKPVDNSLIHVDFCDVNIDVPVVLDVPIKYVGKAKGVELGGEMHAYSAKVTLQGLVLDIPDFIEHDVTDLSLGDNVNFGELAVPADMQLLNKKDDTCLAIVESSKAPEVDEDENAEDEKEAVA